MKEKPAAIVLTDCGSGEITGNTFIGYETAVRATRTQSVKVDGNVMVEGNALQAIRTGDKDALLKSLGLPEGTPPELVGQALQRFSDNSGDAARAEREVAESALARNVGVAADLTQLVAVFYAIVNSGFVDAALRLLLRP